MTMTKEMLRSPNTVRHVGLVSRQDRERLHGHKSFVLWFTGLSGSGKSTIAHQVEKRLYDQGLSAYVLDGDNVRHGLCGDLSFTPEARAENLRRTAEVTKLFLDAGIICLTAFISPLRADRNRVRRIVGAEDFVEIYVSCPLEVCEARDVKGLYKLAREGKIENYTGISAPYEPPENPHLVLETDKLDVEICVEKVIEFVRARL